MRLALALAVLAATATGCFGGSSAGSASSSVTIVSTGVVTQPPQLIVDYWVGRPQRSRTKVVATCFGGAQCVVRRIRGDRPAMWALHVRRELSCGPARGDYAHPGRACRALAQYISLTHHGSVCFCPASLVPGGRVVGEFRGRHIDVFVNFCDACGHGRAAADDVRILTPGQTF